MIFAPEYGGVCSWRIAPPPDVNSRYAPEGGVSVTGRGSRPSMSEMYRAVTPARSHEKVMCFPSGDHTGFEGCLMSISCSIVSGCMGAVFGSTAPATNAATMTVVIVVIVLMRAVYPPANPNFRSH